MIARRVSAGLTVTLLAVVFVSAVAAFAPISVTMPEPGLDQAWMLGMNVAVARGLQIGRDIVFTMGPYAALYSRQFDPATDTMVVAAGLFLAFGYTYLVGLLGSRDRLTTVLLAVPIPYMMFIPDALFASYSLYFAVASARLARAPDKGWTVTALHALAACGLGLLVCVKVSFIWFAVVCAGLSVLILLWHRHVRLAACAALAPVLCLCAAWAVAGQPITGLGAFLASAVPITTGYTEAMATPGDTRDILVYLGAAAIVLGTAITGRRLAWDARLHLVALLGAFLFVMFKAGFVRHDAHAVMAGMAAVIAALALRAGGAAGGWAPLGAAVAAFLAISYGQIPDLRTIVVDRLTQPYVDTFQALGARAQGLLPQRFATGLALIRRRQPIPVLPGTSDIYTVATSVLLASGNRWDPRPVLQSYSAYTPGLQQADLQHLQGAAAPDHIVFRPDAIDGRMPSLEDAPSWPAILQAYEPETFASGFLVLDRRPGADGVVAGATVLSEGTVTLGQDIDIPAADGVVVAAVHLHRTLPSKLAAALFKPAPLTIHLALAGGETRAFRFIGSDAELGFVVSPLIETAADFAQVGSAADRDRRKVVQRFWITQADAPGGVEEGYDVRLSAVPVPATANPAALFDPMLPSPADTPEPAACRGAIDQFDGKPAGEAVSAGRTLSVMGWLAADVQAGTLPDAVFVTLRDGAGVTSFAKAHELDRPDIADAFGHPALVRAGYRIETYTAQLRGRYTVGLAYSIGGRMWACTNLDRLVVFQ